MGRTLFAMVIAAMIGASVSNPDLACRVAGRATEIARQSASKAYLRANHCQNNSESADNHGEGSSELPAPEYVKDTIEHCRFIYTSEKAKEAFHEAIKNILSDIPYDPDVQVRSGNIERMKEAFFSSYFGLKTPERIGGIFLGEYVLDEERASRIRDHAATCHGNGRRPANDPCLKEIISELHTSYHRYRSNSQQHTWNAVAVRWLGAKPASEYRPMSASERAIGNY